LKIIRYSGWVGLLLLALLVSVCSVQSQDASSANANPVANGTVNASSAVGASINGIPANESNSDAGVQTSVQARVQGIWKVSLGENVITASFNQSGESIFGLAKFEGYNPWNGAVAGSLSGNSISLSLAAVEADLLSSSYISGTVEGDSMKGYFIRSDSSGKSTRGEFTATLISPDTSGYTPAAIQTVSASIAELQKITEQNNATVPQPTAQETESKFKDVTQLAGIDPSILPRMASL